MPKINELLKEWKSENPPYAFEFYPPRSKEAVEKLYERLVRSTFERLHTFFKTTSRYRKVWPRQIRCMLILRGVQVDLRVI